MLSQLIVLVLCFQVVYGNYLDSFTTNTVDEFLQNNNSEISALCKEHLLQYIQDLKSGKQWAVKMFDASAKFVPPGVLDGNVVDLGSFDECLNVRHYINGSHVHGKYCIGKISINADLQRIQKPSEPISKTLLIARDAHPHEGIVLQLAKCLPDSCSTSDIHKVYAYYDFDEDLCQTKVDQPKLDAGGIATITVYGIILLVVVASTVYDVTLHYMKKKPSNLILIAFSVFTNGKKLLATTNNSLNDITCMHGIRVISAMWIILHHGFSIRFMFPISFAFYHSDWINDAADMIILSATLAVDTFFLLSGLLISYLFMCAMMKGTKFNIFIHYFHRYLRLMPVLAVIMVFHITLLKLIGSGPFWPNVIQEELVEGCEIHWWKTLLFIQNIFGRGKSMCLPQSWYLSADMQLFLLSPFLILPLKRFSKLALSVTGFLTIMSILTCFLLAWFLELNAYVQGNHGFDKEMNFFWYYYYPPHTRAAPWLIGIVLGYLVFETKQGRIKLIPKATIAVLWIVSFVVVGICVFVGQNLITDEYNKLANSFHLALVRPVWALAIAWIIFACVRGYGGPVNWFLSLPVFQVISKLTYSMYLVHYTIIYIATAQMRQVPMTDNTKGMMHRFWGDFASTFLVSIILTLSIEYPVAAIDTYLFGASQRKRI